MPCLIRDGCSIPTHSKLPSKDLISPTFDSYHKRKDMESCLASMTVGRRNRKCLSKNNSHAEKLVSKAGEAACDLGLPEE